MFEWRKATGNPQDAWEIKYLYLFNFLILFFLKFIYLFIYFWRHWVFIAARGLSLVVASGGRSLLRCTAFSLWWLLLLRSTGPRRVGFSSCGTLAQQLWLAGLVAPQHVGSSKTRARTRVPCIGRWILNHCATREALLILLELSTAFPLFQLSLKIFLKRTSPFPLLTISW